MATLKFTTNLARKIDCPDVELSAGNVSDILEQYFMMHPQVRNYILDDQGEVRKHIMILIDGLNMRDRRHQTDTIATNSEVFVIQALSGG